MGTKLTIEQRLERLERLHRAELEAASVAEADRLDREQRRKAWMDARPKRRAMIKRFVTARCLRGRDARCLPGAMWKVFQRWQAEHLDGMGYDAADLLRVGVDELWQVLGTEHGVGRETKKIAPTAGYLGRGARETLVGIVVALEHREPSDIDGPPETLDERAERTGRQLDIEESQRHPVNVGREILNAV